MNPPPDVSPAGGTLYVVATPIGNREDITLRALRVLEEVDLVAAEDTRHTGRFLAHHRIRSRLVSLHEHNEIARITQLLAELEAGRSVAVVSNAGTPTVSDPGFRLVQAAIGSKIRVVPIPGASAAITALSVSGLPTDEFHFVGFTARKKGRRRQQLEQLADSSSTLIFYESPRRIGKLLDDLVICLGDRQAVLGREMTKQFEEFLRGRLTDLQQALAERSTVKGECTLLVTGREMGPVVAPADIEVALHLEQRASGGSLTACAKVVARRLGFPKNRVYAAALAMTTGQDPKTPNSESK